LIKASTVYAVKESGLEKSRANLKSIGEGGDGEGVGGKGGKPSGGGKGETFSRMQRYEKLFRECKLGG